MRVFYCHCVELPEVHTEPQAAVLFLHHDDRRGPRAVGRTDDAAGQHLLDLGHLLSPNSGVLEAIRLAERRSFGLYGVLQERCTAQIILSLAHNVAEFLEEGLQLLLLGGRQVCGDRRWATRAGSGWWRWSVSDGDDFQRAHSLSGMQAERFWAVIMDRGPYFGSTGKRRYPGHKRRETFLWAKVDVFAGPRVMATDEECCFGGDVDGLQQQSAAGGKVLHLGGVEMNGLWVQRRGSGSAVGDINTDTQRTHDVHSN